MRLQEEYECLYFAADWHALTTHYDASEIDRRERLGNDDRLARGGHQPDRATLFIQSRVPEHAELTLLLGMITPVGWLERVPTYKDQQQKLADRDLSNFGFLGYPVMQVADILIYRANMVPVGEDQVSHIEFDARARAALQPHLRPRAGLRGKGEGRGQEARRQEGAALHRVAHRVPGKGRRRRRSRRRKELLNDTQNLALGDRERLFGYLEGAHRVILPEPQPLLTETPKVPGLDGQKMSKSYGNAIMLREDPAAVTQEDPHDADRSGARAAHRTRATPNAARSGRCTRSIPMPRRATGSSRAAPRRASAASTASSR